MLQILIKCFYFHPAFAFNIHLPNRESFCFSKVALKRIILFLVLHNNNIKSIVCTLCWDLILPPVCRYGSLSLIWKRNKVVSQKMSNILIIQYFICMHSPMNIWQSGHFLDLLFDASYVGHLTTFFKFYLNQCGRLFLG